MFHALESLVDGPTLARLSALAAAAEWQDGRATAGAAAASVKKNAQVPPASAQGRAIAEEVRAAILAHPVASRAALVRRFGPVLATRTGEGGGYGAHVDEATMRTAGRGGGAMRTDLAFTLFLSPPDSYAGGALLVETDAGTQPLKLPAGSAVLYPASYVHAVETVTAGERLVVVGWIESQVADAARRGVLFELSAAMAAADGQQRLLLSHIHGQLMRMWAQP